MHVHTMEFNSFQSKHVAIDWLREKEIFDDLDECLTQKRCVFFTGVALTRHQTARLLKEVAPTSYNVNEL